MGFYAIGARPWMSDIPETMMHPEGTTSPNIPNTMLMERRLNIVGGFFDPIQLDQEDILSDVRAQIAETRAEAEGLEVLVDEVAKDMTGQWGLMKTAYTQLNGSTRRALTGQLVPIMTVGDVLAVIAYWNKQKGNRNISASERERWSNCVNQIVADVGLSPKESNFEDSEHFWYTCVFRLAAELDSLGVKPTTFELVVESISESVAELPGRIAEGARRVSKTFGLGTLVTTLLISAGILLVVVITLAMG